MGPKQAHIGAMNIQVAQNSNDFAIFVEPVAGRVTARRGDVIVAESYNAKVMYETRLRPAIYFPVEDVRVPLRLEGDLRTFCPFKGTATYFTAEFEDGPVEDAAWHYAHALLEGKPVEGMISFMPAAGITFEFDGFEPRPETSRNISGPIIDWLMSRASLCKTPEELTRKIGRKLSQQGVAISRISVLIWSLHPMIAGRNFIWSKETDDVRTLKASYDLFTDPAFINSPMRHVAGGFGGVRQRLDIDERDFEFPILDDLKAEGATDYVAMPMPFSGGQINVLTLTCDHPKGFTTANLGLVYECAPIIGRLYEVFALRENAQSILETYLGRRTGARVLGGEIRRGDGDDIEAAIMMCDLRNSSALEESLGRKTYLETLNWFFEETTKIINDHGGEVLKFIGDAVLAIFPATEGKAEACASARSAARDIVANICHWDGEKPCEHDIDCALGLAFGNVTYGNIGSRERLDFTVIGRATNIAARLSDYGKTQGHRIAVTADIAEGDNGVEPLGAVKLRNVSAPVETFALT